MPDHLASTVTKRTRAASRAEPALGAEAELEALAKELERAHPGAAGSPREELFETLTVLRVACRTAAGLHAALHHCVDDLRCPQSLDEHEDPAEWHHGVVPPA